MTVEEFPAVRRLLKASFVERRGDEIDAEATVRVLRGFTKAQVCDGIERLVARGQRWMPKAGEIVAACETDCGCTDALAVEWAPVAALLLERLGERTFGLWLVPLHPHSHGPDGWVLGAPVEVASWVEDRLLSHLVVAAAEDVRVVTCARSAGEAMA